MENEKESGSGFKEKRKCPHLFSLFQIASACGTARFEALDAAELVEPRLLDSFLIFSSKNESFVWWWDCQLPLICRCLFWNKQSNRDENISRPFTYHFVSTDLPTSWLCSFLKAAFSNSVPPSLDVCRGTAQSCKTSVPKIWKNPQPGINAL